AVIKVGTVTETEMKEKRARVEDAMHATKAAVEEGIVPGGGVALLRAIKAVEAIQSEGDVRLGVNIVRRALEEPARQIAINAGEEGSVVVTRILSSAQNIGFNAATGQYEDLIYAGVIDPAKVTKTALINAASIAGLMLTTEAMVAEISQRSVPLARSVDAPGIRSPSRGISFGETSIAAQVETPAIEHRERRAQALLFKVGNANPVKVEQAPLRPGRYRLDVWIGPRIEGVLVAPDPFPELPPSAAGHELTVVLTAPSLGGEPQVHRLLLPPAGSSEPVHFDLAIGDTVRRLEARIAILHENRILQTLLLLADVGQGEIAPLALGIENVIRRDLDGVTGRQRFDVALIQNQLAGSRTLSVFADSRASLVAADGQIDELTREVGAALEAATNTPKDFGKPSSHGTTTLLAGLARRGVLLRDALLQMPGVRDDLAEARRIQIISSKPDEATLPLEICYDGTAPGVGATICPQWEVALDSGECQSACPLDRGTVVCPVSFWGMSRVIERHAYAKVDARMLGGNSYALQSEPTAGRTRLALAPGSICAAAAAAIAANPSLLVLLAHTDLQEGVRTLVIGPENAAFLSSIDESFVGTAAGHGPIVLLLGCSTAIAERALQSFVARFRRAGAAIVIGTLCEILGQHAAPIASQILAELERVHAGRYGVPLGDLMVVVRRQLLSRGYPIVLAVAAYGDADWLI